jgi:hypothetical protein
MTSCKSSDLFIARTKLPIRQTTSKQWLFPLWYYCHVLIKENIYWSIIIQHIECLYTFSKFYFRYLHRSWIETLQVEFLINRMSSISLPYPLYEIAVEILFHMSLLLLCFGRVICRPTREKTFIEASGNRTAQFYPCRGIIECLRDECLLNKYLTNLEFLYNQFKKKTFCSYFW